MKIINGLIVFGIIILSAAIGAAAIAFDKAGLYMYD